MSRILLIATGGTIASVPSPDGLAPALSGQQLLSCLPSLACQVDCIDLFNMDSSNIQPEEWQKMAKTVLLHMGDYDGVVITHGTDTMAYTASMLTFLFQNPPLPVVLTNLAHAILAARRLAGGVYICFGSAVMRGCRAVKTRTTSLNAFESINAPYVGTVVDGCFIDLTLQQPDPEKHFRYYSNIEPNVALVTLIPGTTAKQLSMLSACDVKGVVVEAFGLGGVSNFRRDHAEALRGLMKQGIPVVLTSQCLYEASTPDLYEVSRPLRAAGVISDGGMTTEAAVTKLMWALAQAKDVEAIRDLMLQNICGEITQ